MGKTLKQLLFEDKRKNAKVKKLEAELKKEKQALATIQKAIPAQRKKEDAITMKKASTKKKVVKKKK